jgi:two-component system NtrC family sensor kinase
MKRRSKAGEEPIKGRRRKTRVNAPKGQARSKSYPATEETEVARLTRELSEERKQRTATAEVLHLMSGSHGDLNRLFDTILTKATKLCQANCGTLSLYEGDAFRIVATHNAPPTFVELRRREPVDSDAATFAKLTGVRTILEVPMLKDDDLVGAIVIYRAEVRRFDDREIALLNDFAAQAVIAIENARLLAETREALEQQTAMADVLRLISRSTFNLQPVLDTLIETAARLCNGDAGSVWLKDGDVLRAIGVYGFSDDNTRLIREARVTPSRATVAARTVREGRPVHIADVRQNPEYTRISRADLRAMLGVPLMRQGIVIGAFSLHRMEPRPFTDKQIELVTTFAAQAVIAIENARLLNELRQRTTDLSERTADLTEALEQQTATSEVLQVKSSGADEG